MTIEVCERHNWADWSTLEVSIRRQECAYCGARIYRTDLTYAQLVESVRREIGFVNDEKLYTQADMDAAVAKAFQDGYENAELWS